MGSPRLVQIIYGEGAGKTTMAIGKAIRAHGNGLKVAVIQFMKPGIVWWEKGSPVTGELASLKKIGIKVYSYGRKEFVQKPIKQDYELAKEALDKAIQLEANMEVLVLDELLNAVSFGLISEEEVIEFVDGLNGTELIITGRILADKIRSKADQVTKVVSEKHPHNKGVKARKGFEY